MPDGWYCQFGDNELGPYSSDQMRAMAKDGRLSPDGLVRNGTSGPWRRAEQLQGLTFASKSMDDRSNVSPTSMSAPPPLPTTSSPSASQLHPQADKSSNSARPIWPWTVAATAAVCLFGCCGLFGFVLVFSDSGEYPSDSQIARLNVVGQDATNELQVLAAQLSNEEKMALGFAVLLTGSDIYAARVRIANTGPVPVRVFPGNIRIHCGQGATEVTTLDHPAFLPSGILQPGYSCEGLVVYEAPVDVGAAIRFGAGGLSYEDPTIQVTNGP